MSPLFQYISFVLTLSSDDICMSSYLVDMGLACGYL